MDADEMEEVYNEKVSFDHAVVCYSTPPYKSQETPIFIIVGRTT
jgi:hypothetical protein